MFQHRKSIEISAREMLRQKWIDAAFFGAYGKITDVLEAKAKAEAGR